MEELTTELVAKAIELYFSQNIAPVESQPKISRDTCYIVAGQLQQNRILTELLNK